MNNYIEILGYFLTGLGTIAIFLLGLIVNYARKTLTEQKTFNVKNSKEHGEINIKLEKGKIWFDEIGKDVQENKADIKVLDRRVDKHDILLSK